MAKNKVHPVGDDNSSDTSDAKSRIIKKMVVPCSTFLCIFSCIGSILTLALVFGQVGEADDLKSRASSMTANDFESIDGGCTIVRSNHSTSYTYAYSQPSCSSNCYSASACSERRIHEFRINSDSQGVLYVSAPEDNLLKVDDTCCSGCSMEDNIWVTEEAKVGQTVPCWRPIDVGSITRNERLSDPRMASYEGLAACRSKCSTSIGYHCGNSECIKLVDPASEREYYEGYAPPSLPLYIGLAAGCLAVLAMLCIGWAIKEKACPFCPCKVCQEEDDE